MICISRKTGISIVLGIGAALLTFTVGALVSSVTHRSILIVSTPIVKIDIPKDSRDYVEAPSRVRCCSEYSSSVLASEILRKRLQSDEFRCYNSRIMEHGEKRDAKGLRVGTRVAAQIGCGIEGQTFNRILWTEGSTYCEVQAATGYEAFNFERAIQR